MLLNHFPTPAAPIMSKEKWLPFAFVALIPSHSSSCCVTLAAFTHLGFAIRAKCLTTEFVFYGNGMTHFPAPLSPPPPYKLPSVTNQAWCSGSHRAWSGGTAVFWEKREILCVQRRPLWPNPPEGNVAVNLEKRFLDFLTFAHGLEWSAWHHGTWG